MKGEMEMDLKAMKRIAERELKRYRDNRAYVQGVIDAGGDPTKLLFRDRASWALAVEYAKTHFERTDPAKAAFFSGYYHLDRPAKKYEGKVSLAAIAMQLHISESTLYHWRNAALTITVMAAIQTGALRPYELRGDGKS